VSTALITGASTGIGRATALRLARSGWSVLAGVRDRAVGEALEAQAQAPGAGRLLAVQLDVTDRAQIAAAVARVDEVAPAGLGALVNNAGVAVAGPLETTALGDLREQMEVNFFAQVAITQALLASLRRARGRIVFLSSIGGRVTTPYMSPYHASKYAIEAIGNALRVELADSGIQVALVEPGSVATPIWEKGRGQVDGVGIPRELHQFYGHVPAAMEKVLENTAKRAISPERVAQTIERALGARRMRARYLVGLDAHVMVWASRVLPDHVFDRVVRRAVGV
jgi:NAD(P)-dependent dehydrogenase (short-subunit alcohol dehydrogenase family)